MPNWSRAWPRGAGRYGRVRGSWSPLARSHVDLAVAMTDTGDLDAGRWVDLHWAVALTGLSLEELGWAMAQGGVRYRTTLPGHGHTPMVALEDVECLGRVAADDADGAIGA